MKPQRQIVAHRPLASHCAQLLRPAPAASELAAVLATAAERLSRSLRRVLTPLLGGEQPMVECRIEGDGSIEQFAAQDGLNAWSVFAVDNGSDRLLSCIDAEAVLRLVDRAFGGPGEAPRPLPRELPLSADLMVQRLEALLAVQLGEALGGRAVIRPLRRDSTLAQIQPFAAETRVCLLVIEVTEGNRTPWSVRFALPAQAMPSLAGLTPQHSAPVRRRGPVDPMGTPFADVPLSLSALLVDVAMPLSAISALEIGQVLNLPITRNVPLRAGEHTLAHGAIGAVDDCVALQISQLS